MFDESKILYLSSVGSTNQWAKDHLSRFAPMGAVWTTCQTEGRGRLGRAWSNAAGQAIYYSVGYTLPMKQPAALPLFASLAIARAIQDKFNVEVQVKWPNDLLIGGKKVAGILCESVNGTYICGVGINLEQPQKFFDEAGLPYATSMKLAGCTVNSESAAERLALRLTRRLTGECFEQFAAEGFAPFLEEYRSRCINLGRHVTFDGGEGVAETVDEEGRLVVRTEGGSTSVLSGEVHVSGIYGAVN